MTFEFATAARIIFGEGSASQLPQLAQEKGSHALLVTDSFQPQSVSELMQALSDADLPFTHFPVSGEPSVELIDQAKAVANAAGCDMVISIGGGSVIDTGKAGAALIPNAGEVLDYLEVIGAGRKLSAAPLPFIALPTTAGTGAEVSKNAVLGSKAHRVKVSLRDNRMLADIALVDPLLTHSVPPAVTASTGMDALTQVLEPYVSHLSTPLTDGFCIEGLRRAGTSLRRVYAEPENASARSDMALTSLMGGLALAECQTGRGAWLCRRPGWDVWRATWRDLRRHAATGDRSQYQSAAGTPTGKSGTETLRICRSILVVRPLGHGARCHGLDQRMQPDIRHPGARRLWRGSRRL